MSASSYASLTLVVGAAVLFATCSGGPSAGELVVELSTSNGDTQAVQFTVTAAESKMVESASPACAGCQVFTVRVGDRDLRGVVTGSIQPGPLLRVLVSDVDAIDGYTARLIDAANGGFILLGATGYTLQVRRP
jgi:hypothetical protein